MPNYEKFLHSARVVCKAIAKTSRRIGVAIRQTLLFQVPHYDRWGLYTQGAVIGVCWAVWKVFYFELAPGDAIAALAVVAVIMTVRASSFTKAEQVVWVLIGFSLFVCETTIIHNDRDRHDQQLRIESARQAAQFAQTLRSFKDIHDQNSTELQKTNSLLRDTDKSLLNITGGNDFGYVLPSENHLRADGFSVRLYHDGNEQLNGVTVRIETVLRDCPWPPEKDHPCSAIVDAGFIHPFQMGTLGPSTSVLIPHMIEPKVDANGISHYIIEIAAQNGIAREQLWFRRTKDNQGWAYKYEVYRRVNGKLREGDFSGEGFNFHPLKESDWKEPPTHP